MRWKRGKDELCVQEWEVDWGEVRWLWSSSFGELWTARSDGAQLPLQKFIQDSNTLNQPPLLKYTIYGLLSDTI